MNKWVLQRTAHFTRSMSIWIAVITAIVNWIVFYYFGVYVANSTEPAFKATIILASVVTHEMAHLIAFEQAGIKSGMIFLFILGGTYPFPESRSKFKQLPWATDAQITLAGVLGNVFIIMVAVGLDFLGFISFAQLTDILNLNGVLILYNLIPIMGTDGQKFIMRLYDSSPRDQDRSYTAGILLTCFMFAALLYRFTTVKFFLSSGLLSLTLGYREKHDHPEAWHDRRAMSRRDRFDYTARYIALMMLAMLIIAFTEPWVH